MKKLLVVAGLGLVGVYVAKKILDKKKENKEVQNEEVENVEEVQNDKEKGKLQDDEYIVGAAKFEGFISSIDKWLEKYERKCINYFKKKPEALAYIFDAILGIIIGKKYGIKGVIICAVSMRWLGKYKDELVSMFQ